MDGEARVIRAALRLVRGLAGQSSKSVGCRSKGRPYVAQADTRGPTRRRAQLLPQANGRVITGLFMTCALSIRRVM